MLTEIPAALLAPCGINCLACYAHLRRKKTCPGCRFEGKDKANYCLRCAIKQCAEQHAVQFCVECAEFPCPRMKRMNKRYTQRYHVELIADARRMQAAGVEQYLRDEQARWSCPACGGVIDMHAGACSECGESAER